MTKIFIDPGHGGKDPGAGGNGLAEKDVALTVSKLLKTELLISGFDVRMSREGDTYPSLADRYTAANAWGADYFISIHCNSAADPAASGTETLVYALGSKAANMAAVVQNSLVRALGTRDRGVKARPDLAVLRGTKMPAILVECGFISNTADAAILRGKQADIAAAIARGMCDFAGVPCNPVTGDKPAEYWAKQHLDSLVAKGIIESPEAWRDFDAPITKGQVLALVDKVSK